MATLLFLLICINSRPIGVSGRTDYAKQYREAFEREQFEDSDEEDDDDTQTVISTKTSGRSLSGKKLYTV